MACASIKERQIVETIITVIPRKTDLPLEVLSNEDKISLCTPEVSFSGLPTQVFQAAAKYSFFFFKKRTFTLGERKAIF